METFFTDFRIVPREHCEIERKRSFGSNYTVEQYHTIKARYAGRKERARDLFAAAKMTLENARRTSEKERQAIRSRLAKKAVALRKLARKTGFKEGYKAGISEACVKFLEMQKSMATSITALNDEVLALALSIAKEIIQDEIKKNKASLKKRIETALHALSHLRAVEIKVNPADLKSLKNALSENPEYSPFKLTPSSEVQIGNAIIVSPCGEIELDWEKHLLAAAKRLKEDNNPSLSANLFLSKYTNKTWQS